MFLSRECGYEKLRLRPDRNPFDFDLDALLHPAQAFEHPMNVVQDTDLTLNEKRAILASWTSDACAVEATPTLRHVPGSPRPVPVDDILDALRALDKEAQACAADGPKVSPHASSPAARRVWRKGRSRS